MEESSFFRKTRPGKMGILTIPVGVRIYNRASGKSERAKKEFDVLALPTTTPDGRKAYSVKIRDELWYVLLEDLS